MVQNLLRIGLGESATKTRQAICAFAPFLKKIGTHMRRPTVCNRSYTPLIGAFLGVSDTPYRKRTGNQVPKSLGPST